MLDSDFQRALSRYEIERLAGQQGVRVWSGELAVEQTLNADVTTAFPVDQAVGALQPGDVFVVWKLDRLSRSLRDLLFTLEKITEAGAGFRSLTEAVDTTTAAGRLMTQTLGAFAEFERAMIRERTMNGLHHARQAGRHLGRRPSLTGPQRADIIAKAESGQGSPAQLANLFRVSRSTVQRVLREHRARLAGV